MDEYGPEAEIIYEDIEKNGITTVKDLSKRIHKVFSSMFYNYNKYPDDRFDGVAKKIFDLLKR